MWLIKKDNPVIYNKVNRTACVYIIYNLSCVLKQYGVFYVMNGFLCDDFSEVCLRCLLLDTYSINMSCIGVYSMYCRGMYIEQHVYDTEYGVHYTIDNFL